MNASPRILAVSPRALSIAVASASLRACRVAWEEARRAHDVAWAIVNRMPVTNFLDFIAEPMVGLTAERYTAMKDAERAVHAATMRLARLTGERPNSRGEWCDSFSRASKDAHRRNVLF